MKTPNQSNICRLCAVNFENGTSLFEVEEDKEIYTLIDEYLPLKIPSDEKLPTKICSTCKTNVQNVAKFFNSVVNGQKLLLKKAKQCVENDDETASKDSAAKTPVDNEIKENLKKIFTSTAYREVRDYKHFNEERKRPISPRCRSINDHPTKKDNAVDKDFKYPKNGRKYFTREISRDEKSQNNIHLGDEQTPQKVFICDICGKKFSHRSSVLYHFHTKHGENQLYNCNECNKKFSSSRLLKRHFKRIHSMIRMSECIHCHATFITEDQLENHLKTCKRSTLTCQQCKKPYKSRTKHECQKDEKLREYRCKVCEKTFKYSSNLYRHQKLHSSERPYQCTKCSRKFPTVSRLRMHENEHNKEYSYKCNICQKTFVNNRILRVHYRRHTRVFPYQCDICCKGFPDKCSIVKHMRVHTGERPYSCDSCEKTFADQSNYLRHKKAHSKNQNPSKNQKLDSVSKKVSLTIKPIMPKTKLRMEIDYSSMTYSNDNSNKQKSVSLNHLLAETPTKQNEYENRNDLKKTFYLDNNSKQFSLKNPRVDKNTVVMPPQSTIPAVKRTHPNEEKSTTIVLKQTKQPNSFAIVKKENNTPALNNSAKVIVIRSRNKNKSKFVLPKSLESGVKKELTDLPTRKEDGSNPAISRNEARIKQNPLSELYSCEKLPPSPTSEYIDVEDLVATFTPNISFEEIGDLNDLVNTKIDL